jgi:hypothetical protein
VFKERLIKKNFHFSMKNKFILFSLLLFFSKYEFSQSTLVPVGHWQSHLPFSYGKSITFDGNKIYCGTMHSLFSYDINTGEYEKFTKVEGLSDLEISRVYYHFPTQSLVVGYENSNIDIISNNEIYNLSQIKNSLIANKKINNIKSIGDTILLACNFGVVLLDIRYKVFKTEVKFSDDVSFSNTICYDIAYLNGYYYFSTSNGVYKVNANSNIKNLNNWIKLNAFADGHYNNIETFNNKLYLNFSGKLTSNSSNSDTLFSFDGTQKNIISSVDNKAIVDLASKNNQIIVLNEDELKVLNVADNVIFTKNSCFTRANQAVFDNQGNIWVADFVFGSFKVSNGACNIHLMEGPFIPFVYDIEIRDSILWAAAGGLTSGFGNTFNQNRVYYRRKDDWKLAPVVDFGYSVPTLDVIDVIIDPQDPLHVYAASWGTGLIEFYNYQPINQWVGPPLETAQVSGFEYKIGGLAFDKNNNLWMSNSHTSTPLKVKRNNNTWGQYGFGSNVPVANASVKVTVDALNNIWMAVIGKGILVFNPQTNNSRLLTNVYNQGDLPSTNVRVMTSDRNGEMWVGTDDGIRIFSPSQVFNNTNINGQKIVIKAEDGNNELLLGETVITDIEVDGANRKWIATDGNGVRLVSENGREIIYSFTAENSPLLSNKVNCIAIDHATGEVYFGTSLGIVSFRAEATEAGNSFGEVYAFPNPVRPDYQGVITITGMADKSKVKITDVSGNLVYETESLGGQAIWDGKRFDGKRVQTGVYLVFCANRDASETVITKILFIN